MEISEILRVKAPVYIGYQLQTIGKSLLTQDDLKRYRALKKIPVKISRFLDQCKINRVFKSDHRRNPIDNF